MRPPDQFACTWLILRCDWLTCPCVRRSTVDSADLHEALEDARQLPIIVAGLQRAAGEEWSVEYLASNPIPPTVDGKTAKPFVDSFANIAAARHASMLRKIGAPPPSLRPSPPAAPSSPASAHPTARGASKARDRTVERSQAAHLAELHDGGSAATAAAAAPGSPPGDSGQNAASTLPCAAANDGAQAEGGASRRPRALEEMLVAQRSALEPDPFLTVTCALPTSPPVHSTACGRIAVRDPCSLWHLPDGARIKRARIHVCGANSRAPCTCPDTSNPSGNSVPTYPGRAPRRRLRWLQQQLVCAVSHVGIDKSTGSECACRPHCMHARCGFCACTHIAGRQQRGRRTPATLCRPRDVPSEDKLLGADVLGKADLADAWPPFTGPLRAAGLPRMTFRAPLLDKLEDAGFASVLDVRPAYPPGACLTPPPTCLCRAASQLLPSVHQLSDSRRGCRADTSAHAAAGAPATPVSARRADHRQGHSLRHGPLRRSSRPPPALRFPALPGHGAPQRLPPMTLSDRLRAHKLTGAAVCAARSARG